MCLSSDKLVCMSSDLRGHEGKDIQAGVLGEVRLLDFCVQDGGGGDGRDSVRPAALLWRVTSSTGPWHCGSSTKPCRGQREMTTHECGGGTGCGFGCRCE